MTSFTIHESNWTEEFYTTYNQIKQDFSNGMLVKDIKIKHGLTEGRWLSYRKELINDGLITPKKSKEKGKYSPRNYSFNNGFYQVQKWINGKLVHICSFRKECDAKQCVRLMRECDWDIEQISRVKKEVLS